jgi:Protein of unknown function (DUF3667)
MNIVCKNCDTHFKGNYCPSCAQKASLSRLTVGSVIHELWHNFTHTDKGVVGLLVAMCKTPGKVIREYIDGKRKKYFSPYTFFLLVTALLIYVSSLVFHYEDKLYHYNNEYGQYINKKYNLIVLLSLPFLAGILKLIFFKRKYNYAEWVVFFIFSFGLSNCIQVLIQCFYFPFIQYHYKIKGYTDWASYLIFILVLISFIQPKNIWNWLQCIIASIIVYLFVEELAPGIALLLWGVPLNSLLK